MRRAGEEGLTLVELLLSLAVMGIIAAATMPLLSASLEVDAKASARSELYQEGLRAMERMTKGVRKSTYLLIPNAHNPVRHLYVDFTAGANQWLRKRFVALNRLFQLDSWLEH